MFVSMKPGHLTKALEILFPCITTISEYKPPYTITQEDLPTTDNKTKDVFVLWSGRASHGPKKDQQTINFYP